MESTIIIYGIIAIVSGVLSIILFFKIWGMTDNVKVIKNKIAPCSPLEECRLLALKGKKEEAFERLKDAMVDSLESIIIDLKAYNYNIGDKDIIEDDDLKETISRYVKASKLTGFQLPPHLQSAEEYIKYRNDLLNDGH